MKRLDARWLVGVGLGLFAASNFMNVGLNAEIAADQLLAPNIVRALGQALVLTPLTAIAVGGIAVADAASASALLNVMRNLGGAIGIAGLQTFLSQREQFHFSMLGQSVSLFDETTRQRLEQLMRYFESTGVHDPAVVWQKSVLAIGDRLQHQASIMAFGDIFYVLGAALALALVAALLMKKPASAAAIQH
jgi:DHA2 family multidrug resistance protein